MSLSATLQVKNSDCCRVPRYPIKMFSEFISSVVPPDSQNGDALWFVYSGYRLIVKVSGDTASIPATSEIEALGVNVERRLFLGYCRGRPCFAAEGTLPGEIPADATFQELRSLFELLETGIYEIALLGVHLVEWDKTCQFCSTCRGPLKQRTDMRAKECAECGRFEFPRISPAIIVLIEKGIRCSLPGPPGFPDHFSASSQVLLNPEKALKRPCIGRLRRRPGSW